MVGSHFPPWCGSVSSQFPQCDAGLYKAQSLFTHYGLKAADAVLLAYDIKVNTPLTTLHLGGNEIGVEGAKAIAGALPR